MNKNATLVFHPDNSSLNNTEHTDIPELDTQTANQLLDNVFAACDMEPSVVPVEVLESWGNYKKAIDHRRTNGCQIRFGCHI